MRPTLLIAGTLVFIVHALPAQAQNAPTMKSITVQEVLVRSGVTEKFYATSKLRMNDKVVVLGPSESQDTALKIRPPVGSFSWVNARMIDVKGKHWGVVHAAPDGPVDVLAGSALTSQKPDVVVAKLKQGDIVVILDDPMEAPDGTKWLPIDVTPQEVRYIPASAVQGSKPEPVNGDSAVDPNAPTNLIKQADQAYLSHNLTKARNLYLIARHKTHDYEQKVYCAQRLGQIDQTTKAAGPAGQPGYPQYLASKGPSSPVMLANQSTKYPPVPAQTANLVNTKLITNSGNWTKWGKLRKTNSQYQGQRIYALVDSQEKVVDYAITSPALTLETYVGRTICLYGSAVSAPTTGQGPRYLQVTYVAFP